MANANYYIIFSANGVIFYSNGAYNLKILKYIFANMTCNIQIE